MLSLVMEKGWRSSRRCLSRPGLVFPVSLMGYCSRRLILGHLVSGEVETRTRGCPRAWLSLIVVLRFFWGAARNFSHDSKSVELV